MTLHEYFIKNKKKTDNILVIIIDDASQKNDGYFHRTSKYPLDFMMRHKFGKYNVVKVEKDKGILQPHIIFNGTFPKDKYDKLAIEELI